MSGSRYRYQYHSLQNLADDIEDDLGEMRGDDFYHPSPENKQIVKNAEKLIKNLRKLAQEARALEWYRSGDYGVESYFKELEEIKGKK